MVLRIARYGEPVLREPGKAVQSPLGEDVLRLMQDMLDTMRSVDGVGLAAQQVGKALQLAVVDVSGVKDRPSRLWLNGKEVNLDEAMPLYLINPEMELTKAKERGSEGCLSFPKLSLMVNRSRRVRFKTDTLDGARLEYEATGLLARAVQHEYDHLQGRLFIDYLTREERKKIKDALEEIKTVKKGG
jgi:peptide deformylase